MFGLGDKKLQGVAQLLMEDAKKAKNRYLFLEYSEMQTQIAADFADNMRFVSRTEVSFSYEAVPWFSFTILSAPDEPNLTIFGSRDYSGFMLQTRPSSGGWSTYVSKPAAFPIGRKAQAIADYIQRECGASNLNEFMRRFGN